MGFTESPFKIHFFKLLRFGSILPLQFNKILTDIFNLFSNFTSFSLLDSFCFNYTCPLPAIMT
jgi:hypothetical protein